MADYDAFMLGPARAYYDALDSGEQRKVDDLIRDICSDPLTDLPLKVPFPFPPYNPVLYLGDEFYLVYDFENNWTLAIWNIGRDDDDLTIPGPPDHR